MPKFDVHTRVITDRNGYNFLAKMYYEIKDSPKDLHLIDFSNCVYFDANLASALGAILDELKSFGHRFNLRIPRKSDIFKTLSRNGFLKIWLSESIDQEKENFIKYQRFPSGSANQFKQYIDEWLMRKQKFPKHTELAGNLIQESIYEIYANAVGHGETEFVYSCGEYKTDPHTLDMTIVDCGRTIPYNVNRYLTNLGHNSLNSTEALQWAMVHGNTTKSIPGGLGLAILTDFINLNDGALQIVSGDAFLELQNGQTLAGNLDNVFPGTIVNMKFNFDDNKKYRMSSERQEINKKDLL